MIAILLAEGFEEIEAITCIDLLRRVNLDVQEVSLNTDLIVRGAHNIEIKAEMSILDLKPEAIEMLILPGGMPGTKNLNSSKEVQEILTYVLKNDKYIAAICAAPSILGKRNMLQGKKATCYPSFEDELLGCYLSKDKVVIDGRIVTSRGPGTAIEFSLALIELLKGKEEKEKIAQDIIYAN